MEHEDWIELYNAGDVAVDIAGYYVSDRIDNPQKWMVPVGVPDSTVIPSGGFVLLYADDDDDQGWNHMNFKLNNEGEHAALRSPDGFTVLDSLDIPLLPALTCRGVERMMLRCRGLSLRRRLPMRPTEPWL